MRRYQQAAPKRIPDEARWRLWLAAITRVLIGVGVIMMAAVIVGLSILFYRWLDAPVLAVAIANPLHKVSQIELESIVNSTMDGGFLSLDIDALCLALEAHPWVAGATVRRYWPDRIEITVVEEVAIARWGQHGFVNQRGQISELGDADGLASLPHLSGPEGSVEDVMREYRDISELLLAEGLKVSEFGMDKHRRWRMRLDTGFSVWLGRQHVLAKVRRFLLAWSHELKMRKDEISLVDARYENGVAVTWR